MDFTTVTKALIIITPENTFQVLMGCKWNWFENVFRKNDDVTSLQSWSDSHIVKAMRQKPNFMKCSCLRELNTLKLINAVWVCESFSCSHASVTQASNISQTPNYTQKTNAGGGLHCVGIQLQSPVLNVYRISEDVMVGKSEQHGCCLVCWHLHWIITRFV